VIAMGRNQARVLAALDPAAAKDFSRQAIRQAPWLERPSRACTPPARPPRPPNWGRLVNE